MVAAVSPAKAGPHLYARIPATKLTSKKVGTTLKTCSNRISGISQMRDQHVIVGQLMPNIAGKHIHSVAVTILKPLHVTLT